MTAVSDSGAGRQAFVSRAPKLGFIGGFDGLRGIGIIAVMMAHASDQYTHSFAAWVDLFFVISGFLIASLLIQEYSQNNSINVRKFYTRRALRLLPTLWLLFIVAFIVAVIVDLGGGFHGRPLLPQMLKEIAASFFYVYHNFYPVGTPSPSTHPIVLYHLWSLSVEEQFYFLIVPLMIFVLRRNRVRAAMGVLLATGVFIGMARLTSHAGPNLLWVQRPDGLVWGVLAAFINAHLTEPFMVKHRRKFLTMGTFAAGLAIFGMVSSLTPVNKIVSSLTGVPKKVPGWSGLWWPLSGDEIGRRALSFSDPVATWWWWRFGFTATMLGVGGLILCLVRYKDWWLSRFLSHKPFLWLGRMSYTLYVWHAFIFIVLGSVFDGLGLIPAVLIKVAITFAITIPIHYKLEVPIMKRKLKFASEKETVDVEAGKVVASGSDS